MVTKVYTLDNSKGPVPKFISSSPLINHDDFENEDDYDNEEEDDQNVTSPKLKEHKVIKKHVLQKIICSSIYRNTIK